jgi:C4-dicarboxylate-specific signal transduction histidine kinase
MTKTSANQVQGQAQSADELTDVDDRLDLRRAQLEVFGRTFGDVTHDVQNNLAVINESAGWMQDLLNLKKKKGFGRIVGLFKRNRGKELDVEPFLEGLESIHDHVGKAAALTRHLSRFADRMDEAKAVIDANHVLEEIQDALREQAADRGIRLEVKPAKKRPMVETEPAAFQLCLFANIAGCIERQKEGAPLVVEADMNEGGFHLHVTGTEGLSGLPPAHPDSNGFALKILEKLGGEIRSQPDDAKNVITLVFPLAGNET